ncbi:MAG: hypothetical protein LBU89_09105 [Fibromonadaceae bacterium]|nr:hypothetical protein [Fibromonadaceae bacterium]
MNSSNQNTHRAGEQRHRAEEQRHRAEAQRHRAEAQRHCTRATARVAPTDNAGNGMDNDANIGRIVGAYKSLVLKKCLEMSKRNNCILGKLWQRNYYEHIIRNEDEYAKIKEYIYNNPILWENDSLNHR